MKSLFKKISIPIVFIFTLFPFHTEGSDKVLRLTIEDTIQMAVEKNLSIKVEGYNARISEADILTNEGEFDPILNFELNDEFNRRLVPTIIASSDERMLNFNAALTGKILYGTEYELNWSNGRVKRSATKFLTINPYYSSDLRLEITQPILKGLGKSIQGTNIEVAKNTHRISKFEFDSRVIDTAAEASKLYWDLLIEKSRLEVIKLALTLAKRTYDEVKAKINVGVAAPVEIYNVEADVAAREDALVDAERDIKNAEDDLKSILNLDDWSIRIKILSIPPVPTILPDLEKAIEKALITRKDYQETIIEKKNKEILAKFFKNKMLPELNIVGSVGLNGLNDDYPGALDELTSGDQHSWGLGLSFTMPIGNRTNRGDYYKAKYEAQQTEFSLKDLKKAIVVETREAWRAVKYSRKRIATTEKTRIAAEKRLEAEEGRYEVGLTTLTDVLEFQREYAEALFEEKKSKIDYAKALAELKRVQGEMPWIQ